EIGVGAELRPLLGARHEMRLDLEPLGLRLQLPRQRLVLRRAVRRVEATGDAEIASDLLGRDELRRPGERALPFLDDAEGRLGTVALGERGVARLHAGRDL